MAESEVTTAGGSARPAVSVIIRTYNEAKYLDELLSGIAAQERADFDVEVVLVDSGSTDGTLDIARRHGARIVHIRKEDFTFGRSLNVGCRAAAGLVFVMISGHCVPASPTWLKELVRPLLDDGVSCSYGRQIGRDTTKFSEGQLLAKYFPEYSKPKQEGFFCNNANAAVRREVWERFAYNEELTGLEDMYLARQIQESGGTLSYVASAGVFHIHDESWRQVRVRYEREAVALQRILPNVHFNLLDFLVYFVTASFQDILAAARIGRLGREFGAILKFRSMQYWGTYRGSRRHRLVSAAQKHTYFYAKDVEREKYVKEKDRCFVAHEGQQ
ncbi:glycosyltransferase [Ramlibacter sp. XY19]|uniref:glycosyltransferase n=1 Tax=Ramlibacter paludis TaxID=2908000 RepID=UPI0023DB7C29|nr:glycosyltransferase [Ramlibacter paludis]MCG2592018.1 glycosyltransferase [Ramlibacter paludis]